MASDLPEAEARGIISTEKIIQEDWMYWKVSPEHGTQAVFTATPVDSSGITIAGLSVELAIRIPARFDDCKYTFSVFSFSPTGRKRAYQLEVIPPDELGHVDSRGTIFGPHEHVGTLVTGVSVPNLGCEHHDKWFREFCSRANVTFRGTYVGPFDGGGLL